MKRCKNFKAGQTIAEFAIMASIVLGISILGVIFFGDNISSVFKNSNILAVFNHDSKRTSFDEDSLANAHSTMTIDGISIDTGLVSSLASKNEGSIQTSGASGNITETIMVMLETAKNMLNVLNSSGLAANDPIRKQMETSLAEYLSNPLAILLSEGLNANSDAAKALQDILGRASTDFSETLKQNIGENLVNDAISVLNGSKDSLAALGTAEQMIKTLEMSIDNKKDGTVSKEFETEMNNLLSGVNNDVQRQLIEQFTKDLVSLGGSLEVKVDSRLMGTVKTKIEEYMNTVSANNQALFAQIDALINNSNVSSTVKAMLQEYKKLLTNGQTYEAEQLFNRIASALKTNTTPISTTTISPAVPIGGYSVADFNKGEIEIPLSIGGKISIDFTQPSNYYGWDAVDYKYSEENCYIWGLICVDTDYTSHETMLIDSNGNKATDDSTSRDENNQTAVDLLYDTFKDTIVNYYNNPGADKRMYLWEIPGDGKTKRYMVMPVEAFSSTSTDKYWRHDTIPVWIYQADASCTSSSSCANSVTTLMEFAKNDIGVSFPKTTNTSTSNPASMLSSISPDKYRSTEMADALKYLIENNSLSEQEIAQINVYREGNYNELMPDSYNNSTLCTSIGGKLVDGKCNL